MDTVDPRGKPALRARAMAARDAAHGHADPAPALAALHDRIGALAAPGAVIAGYRAMRSEIDPAPVLAALAAAGHPVCLPVVARRAAPLVFRAWVPGAALSPGGFGSEVPVEGAELEPDLLIVPLVAFDAACNRLGYGGGFYDRTLAKLRAKRAVPALGLAYAAQRLERLPAEATDQRLDAVITEAGTFLPG